MNRLISVASIGLAGTFAAIAPVAAETACKVEGDPFEMADAAVHALYDCMSDRMIESYRSEGAEIAADYRQWTVTATRPGVAGPHGNRFLLTFANDVAADQYLAFEEGAFEMPVGSVLVKESIGVSEGEARVGPLFVMTKVEDAPENDNWLYSALQPNGKPMQISQAFCHDCHGGFDLQDSLGYPLEEIRAGN